MCDYAEKCKLYNKPVCDQLDSTNPCYAPKDDDEMKDYKEIHQAAYDEAREFGFDETQASVAANQAVTMWTGDLIDRADMARKERMESE